MSATLAEIGQAVGSAPDRAGDTIVADVTHDSRAVGPGWLFCAVTGSVIDGHRFAADAVDAGAAGLLVERPLELDVGQLVVPDSRRVMGLAAATVHGHPSAEMTVVGVTGTNGKSSVAQILADIWSAADSRSEVLGTLTGARTTPEATDLQRHLGQSLASGVEMVAMEVSSHALELSRVVGTSFAAAIFTNLGRDHLDFHPDLDAYFAAKARLFDPAFTPLAVVNGDDQYGRRLLRQLDGVAGIGTIEYRASDAVDVSYDQHGSSFVWRGHKVELPLVGPHNVSNALAAAATASAVGIDEALVADALGTTQPVRGRFELVDAGQPFTVAVDYAHTPDALAAAIGAARQVTSGQVIVLFGCGGDRDQEKRPEMASVAEGVADVVVVTSDNPRSEEPGQIIADIMSGFEMPGLGSRKAHMLIVDANRRLAIGAALAVAKPGDLVLLAGKGHETTQVIGDQVLPFDDRAVARELLEDDA